MITTETKREILTSLLLGIVTSVLFYGATRVTNDETLLSILRAFGILGFVVNVHQGSGIVSWGTMILTFSIVCLLAIKLTQRLRRS